jgi:hypothetical protein
MSQETIQPRDPVEDYWATHGDGSFTETQLKAIWGTKALLDQYFQSPPRKVRHELHQSFLFEEIEEREALERVKAEPWSNGRYAGAALVWGLVALVVLGLGAGP